VQNIGVSISMLASNGIFIPEELWTLLSLHYLNTTFANSLSTFHNFPEAFLSQDHGNRSSLLKFLMVHLPKARLNTK